MSIHRHKGFKTAYYSILYNLAPSSSCLKLQMAQLTCRQAKLQIWKKAQLTEAVVT